MIEDGVKLPLGTSVMWHSQSQGRLLAKVGHVVAVIMPGTRPCLIRNGKRVLSEAVHLPPSLRPTLSKLGGGDARDHVSYLIAVGHLLYWPKVEVLKVVSDTAPPPDEDQRLATLRILQQVEIEGVRLSDVAMEWVDRTVFDRYAMDNTFVVGPFRFSNQDVPGDPSKPYRPRDPLYGMLKGGRWVYSST